MNRKQQLMLKLLNKRIQMCERCGLHSGGRCSPYFTNESKFTIIGEAPGKNEVNDNTPFCGTAGKYLWDIMNLYGFRREEFLIINSVNCRPVKDNKNGKPTYKEMEACKGWLYKYLRVLLPEAVLILGNYAMYSMINESQGIMGYNGDVIDLHKYHTKGVLSVHPSLCIYRGSEGKQMLNDSVKKFKEVVDND